MGSDIQPPALIKKRVASIDALRGFDMFWIAGGESIIHALYKVWPGAATGALDRQFGWARGVCCFSNPKMLTRR